MHTSRGSSRRPVSFSLVVLSSWILSTAVAESGHSPETHSPCTGVPAGESERVAAHLSRVERLLRERDAADLAPEQRLARARALDALHAYRTRGVFPHNHADPDRPLPHFVDGHGTRCAMAHLIEASGEPGLVARVAATANRATIGELAADAELLARLEAHGLAIEEAALIQPYYYGEPDPGDERVPAGLAIGTALVTGAAATTITLNHPFRSSKPRSAVAGLAGLGAGAFGVVFGVAHLDEPGASQALAAANLGLGLVSFVLGGQALGRGGRDPTLAEEATEPGITWALSPYAAPDEAAGRGLAVALRF